MTLGRQDLLCSFFVLDRKHGGMTCCRQASMFTYQYATCMQDKATVHNRRQIFVQYSILRFVYTAGWAKKPALFLKADNFAKQAVERRVICQEVSNFVLKKVSN